MHDLNDWICFRCQARPKQIFNVCGHCFGDGVVSVGFAFFILVGAIGLVGIIAWVLVMWAMWLLG